MIIKYRGLLLLGLTLLLIGSTSAFSISEPEEGTFHPGGDIEYTIDIGDLEDVEFVNVTLEGAGFYERRHDESSGEFTDSRDISDTDYGVYDITAEAFDSQNESLDSVTVEDITIDGESPELLEDSIEDGDVISESSPDLDAIFEDTVSGLQNASITFDDETIYLEENDVNSTDQVPMYISASNLDQEDYSFDVWAQDRAGNEDSETWEFTVDTEYEGPDSFDFDSEPGVIDVEEEDREIDVTVEATGEEQTEKKLRCFVNGDEVDTDGFERMHTDDEGDETTFTCDIPSSYDGQWFEFEVELVDEAGNPSDSRYEDYGFDAISPSVDAIESVNGISVFNEDFDLEYAATDDVAGVDIVEYYVNTDPGLGEGRQYQGGSGAFTVDTEDLEQGSHTVYVRARDDLGKWGDTDSFEFEFYPDEVPELEIEAEDVLNITAGDTENLEVELTNTGMILVPGGEVKVSEIGKNESYERIAPNESEIINLVFETSEDDLGRYSVELDPNTVEASKQVNVSVVADEDKRDTIEGNMSRFLEEYQNISEEVEKVRPGLSSEREQRLNANYSTLEESIKELESAVENGEYYRADEILRDMDNQVQAAQSTFEEVHEEQRIDDRNSILMVAGLLAIFLVGGGVGFLAYRTDYELDIDLEAVQDLDLDDYELDLDLDLEENGWLDGVREKVEGLTSSTGEDESSSEKPEYQFK